MSLTTAPARSSGDTARGWLTLLTICAAQFMVALDFSIVTVALPAIGRGLRFADTGALQWVMTAFILPTAGLLLLFGRVSDLLGRRPLFIAGLLTVTGFSLVAGLADAPWMLIAARAGQGIGSAMVGATALALLTATFPEGPRRDRALGVSGALLSLGFVVGTIGGGIITEGLTWRWTMLILVIMGALVLAGAVTLLPRDDERRRARLDVPGAALATAGLLAVVFGISMVGESGWADPKAFIPLVLAVPLLASFLWVEGHRPDPLAPLSILDRGTVKWGGLAGFITFGMAGGVTVLLSLYMQDVLHWSPLRTGIGFLAEGAAAIVSGALASRLIGRLGTAPVLIGGLLIQAGGTAAMLLLSSTTNVPVLLAATAALGFGHVLAVVSFIGTMTSGVPAEHQGLASGLAQTAQQVGTAVGVAVLAAVVGAGSVGGLRAGFGTAVAVVLAGVLVAAVFLRRPAAVSSPGGSGR